MCKGFTASRVFLEDGFVYGVEEGGRRSGRKSYLARGGGIRSRFDEENASSAVDSAGLSVGFVDKTGPFTEFV